MRLSQLPQLTLPALFMHPRVGYRARSGKCNRVEWYLYPLMGTICGPFTFDFDILWVLRLTIRKLRSTRHVRNYVMSTST